MTVASLLAAPGQAEAEDRQKIKALSQGDQIIVIQRKPFLRKGRVEIEPHFRASFNDSLVQQLSAGLSLNYHITESFFIGAHGAWQDWRWISADANSYTSIYERTIDATDSIPRTSVVNAYVGGDIGYVPIYGKMTLFNAGVIHWDLSLKVGGGVVHTRASGAFGGAGWVAAGQRFFLTDWLSLNTEVRGIFYGDNLSNDPNAGSKFYQQWVAGVGLAFWAPFSFEYSD
jgi:outer membrane beta-barrel protein